MTFDIGESINEIADVILAAPIVNTIASNPIYTALVMTLVVVLLIMIIFRDVDSDESMLTLLLRGGFWIFTALCGIIFLHNKVLTQDNIKTESNDAMTDVFKGAYNGEVEDAFVPII
jgi:hypothetical protein